MDGYRIWMVIGIKLLSVEVVLVKCWNYKTIKNLYFQVV